MSPEDKEEFPWEVFHDLAFKAQSTDSSDPAVDEAERRLTGHLNRVDPEARRRRPLPDPIPDNKPDLLYPPLLVDPDDQNKPKTRSAMSKTVSRLTDRHNWRLAIETVPEMAAGAGWGYIAKGSAITVLGAGLVGTGWGLFAVYSLGGAFGNTYSEYGRQIAQNIHQNHKEGNKNLIRSIFDKKVLKIRDHTRLRNATLKGLAGGSIGYEILDHQKWVTESEIGHWVGQRISDWGTSFKDTAATMYQSNPGLSESLRKASLEMHDFVHRPPACPPADLAHPFCSDIPTHAPEGFEVTRTDNMNIPNSSLRGAQEWEWFKGHFRDKYSFDDLSKITGIQVDDHSTAEQIQKALNKLDPNIDRGWYEDMLYDQRFAVSHNFEVNGLMQATYIQTTAISDFNPFGAILNEHYQLDYTMEHFRFREWIPYYMMSAEEVKRFLLDLRIANIELPNLSNEELVKYVLSKKPQYPVNMNPDPDIIRTNPA